jgi:hypothetical protein
MDVSICHEYFETIGTFIGMSPETNYCIFVIDHWDKYRIHYVVAENVRGVELGDGLDISIIRALNRYMNSDAYCEPKYVSYYTPVLNITHADLCKPGLSINVYHPKKEYLENTESANYCDMV